MEQRYCSELIILKDAAKLVRDFDHILQALVIDPERSLAELNLDWTCSQEIADVMMRKYQIPFRTGHHFASEIVTYARKNNIPPSDFSKDKSLPAMLPLTRAEFKAALNPAAIVAARAVKGGPQPAEMAKMLQQCDKELQRNKAWTDAAVKRQQEAENKLNKDFAALLNENK